MKVKKFHQYVIIERGPVKSAIIDFLKGNIFHVENRYLDIFNNRDYKKVSELTELLEKECLLIEVDKEDWIPRISFETIKDKYEKEEPPFKLEVEEGADLELIKRKFKGFEVSNIDYYVEEVEGKYTEIIPFVNIVIKKKDFNKCIDLSANNSKFSIITKEIYYFNMNYNSCWGKKIAINKDGRISPCIFSKINLGDIKKDDVYDIIESLMPYWEITQDKIEKCKDCEFKNVCFDCREIAYREKGELYAPNPNCKYNPYKGVFE